MENNKKIVAIQVSQKEQVESWGLIKKPFTTNPLYLGNTKDDVPVYVNKNLNKGEIKEIMQTEFKNLPEGKYLAEVGELPYVLHSPKNSPVKTFKVIPLTNFRDKLSNQPVLDEYNTNPYCHLILTEWKDGNQQAVAIGNTSLAELCQSFKITTIEQLYKKEVQVDVYKNKKGYTQVKLMKPINEYNYQNDEVIDVEINGAFKVADGSKYGFNINFTKDGVEYSDVVWYHSARNEQIKWNFIVEKLGATEFNAKQRLENACVKCVLKTKVLDSGFVVKNLELK